MPGLENAYVATAHGVLGVTLAPGTGAALREFIETGVRPAVLTPFGVTPG
jgi:glycine/D-amino acid oxidase-like deaminating enzyme